MKDRIIIILLVLAAILLGFSINSLINPEHNSSIQNENEPVKDVLKSETQNTAVDEATKIRKTIKSKTANFATINKVFYDSLLNCEKLSVATKNGYIAYIIEGIEDNNCHFTHKQVGFMDTICVLPLDVSRRYATEGLNELRQLDELKAQNKTGFVQSSEYINEIINNKNYCKFEYYSKK